jgi:hypothetical protein
MLVATGAEFLQFKTTCSIALIFFGGVTVHTRFTFVGVGATFGAFHGDDDASAGFGHEDSS